MRGANRTLGAFEREQVEFLHLRNAIDFFTKYEAEKSSNPLSRLDPLENNRLELSDWEGISTNALRCLALAKGSSLKSVSLTSCDNLNDVMFEAFCARLDGLIHLDLSRCTTIGDSSVRAATRFCGQRTLVSLKLMGCASITSEACGWMAGVIGHHSPRLRRIQSLDLSCCNQIDDRGLQFLAKGCKTLRYLNLSFCPQLTSKGLCHLSKGCSLLKVLSLRGCDRISDNGVVALSQGCHGLVSLNLSLCNMLSDRTPLAISEGCSKLQALSFEGLKYITEEGICGVARRCPGLMMANFTGCKITRGGLLALIQGIGYVKEAQTFFGFVPIQNAVDSKLVDQESMIYERAASRLQVSTLKIAAAF